MTDWKDATLGQKEQIFSLANPTNFPTKPSCLQVVGFNDATLGKIVINYVNNPDVILEFNWNALAISGYCSETLTCSSKYNLGISVMSSKNIRFYCKGEEILQCEDTNRDLKESVQSVTVKGFQRYWDGVGTNAVRYRPKNVCLLGQSVGYRNGKVVLGAPGFDWAGRDFSGGMFTDNDNTLQRSSDADLMGLSYHSESFEGDIFDATMGKKDFITGTIDVLMNYVVIQVISGEDYGEDFSQFGFDLKFLKCNTILELLISAPFSKGSSRNQFDCGKVYIFQFDKVNNKFTLKGSLSSSCGRFGYSIGLLGDPDGDGCNDIAISAPGIQRIAIYQGSESGLEMNASQVVEFPQGKVKSFGHKITSISAANDYTTIAVADPLSESFHMFRSLPVAELAKTVSCGSDRWNTQLVSNITCTLCHSIKPDYNPKNLPDTDFTIPIDIGITLSLPYMSPTSNLVSNITSTVTTCFNLDLIMFDTITSKKELVITLSYGYQDFTNRILAIRPGSMKELTHKVKLEGMCGEVQCVADFSISITDLKVNRSDTNINFKNLADNKTDVNSGILISGSGAEYVTLTLNFSLIEGVLYDEIVKVNVPSGFNLSDKSSALTSETWGDEEDFSRWFAFPAAEISDTELFFDVLDQSYTGSQVKIYAEVTSFINIDLYPGNNQDTVYIPIKKLVEASSYAELVPADINYRLRSGNDIIYFILFN